MKLLHLHESDEQLRQLIRDFQRGLVDAGKAVASCMRAGVRLCDMVDLPAEFSIRLGKSHSSTRFYGDDVPLPSRSFFLNKLDLDKLKVLAGVPNAKLSKERGHSLLVGMRYGDKDAQVIVQELVISLKQPDTVAAKFLQDLNGPYPARPERGNTPEALEAVRVYNIQLKEWRNPTVEILYATFKGNQSSIQSVSTERRWSHPLPSGLRGNKSRRGGPNNWVLSKLDHLPKTGDVPREIRWYDFGPATRECKSPYYLAAKDEMRFIRLGAMVGRSGSGVRDVAEATFDPKQHILMCNFGGAKAGMALMDGSWWTIMAYYGDHIVLYPIGVWIDTDWFNQVLTDDRRPV